jgi:hypothetical protein
VSTPPVAGPDGGDASESPRAMTSPQVSVAPATRRRRLWPKSVPSRIGRARTSTVVLGLLFVLAGLLYVPPVPTGTTAGTPAGDVSPVTTAPAQAPATTTEPAPSTATDDTATTTAPTSAPEETTTEPQETGSTTGRTTSAPTRTPATTTRAPETTTPAPARSPASEPAAPTT